MISIEGVSHRYGQREVLRDIHLTLSQKRIGIVGANGSGKSTLARMFNALLVPDEGRIEVLGQDTRSKPSAIRKQVGFMFTDPDAQIVMPLVGEDMAFSLRGSSFTKEAVQARVQELAARFGLSDHLDHPAHDLSGGQKQLLALCSMLIREPKIVVCDEPTTLLDIRNTRTVTTALHQLEQQVILLTHDLELLQDFDRVIVLEAGQVVADGLPSDSIAAYRALVQEKDQDQ